MGPAAGRGEAWGLGLSFGLLWICPAEAHGLLAPRGDLVMPGWAGWQDSSPGSTTTGCPSWALLRSGLTRAELCQPSHFSGGSGQGPERVGQAGRGQDPLGASFSESVSSDCQLLEAGHVGLGQWASPACPLVVGTGCRYAGGSRCGSNGGQAAGEGFLPRALVGPGFSQQPSS